MRKVVDIKPVIDMLERIYHEKGWEPSEVHFSLRDMQMNLGADEFDYDTRLEGLELKNQTLTSRFETINAALDMAEKRIYELKAKCEKLEAEKDDAVQALLFAMVEFSKKTDWKNERKVEEPNENGHGSEEKR